MNAGDSCPGKVVKRSVAIAGHRTSVSLEEAFWSALKRIAEADGVSLAALVAQVDAERGEANLSSALRVFALERSLSASSPRTEAFEQ
jgi:predicted DNA-binding ribbon-helix-helix protein